MFSHLLVSAIESIDAVAHFSSKEIQFIIECYKNEATKYRFGFETSCYLRLLSQDRLSDEDATRKEKLGQKLGHYISISADQPEEGVIKYTIENLSELTEKGIETDIPKATRMFSRYLEMVVIHGCNSLVMLITRFEEFISAYLEVLFEKFPQKYIDKQSVEFKDISPFAGIDEIRDFLVQRAVDKSMRQEYSQWFKIFEEHGMRFSNVSAVMKELAELYARRNIWVHNSGYVNSSYLALVPDSTYPIGEKLLVTQEYISNAIRVIKTIIYAILLETTKIVEKALQEDYLTSIFNNAFEALLNQEYALASYVFSVLKSVMPLPADYKLMAQVNCWIAEIAQQGLDKYICDIQAWDVSAYDKSFLLAKRLLLRQYVPYKIGKLQIQGFSEPTTPKNKITELSHYAEGRPVKTTGGLFAWKAWKEAKIF